LIDILIGYLIPGFTVTIKRSAIIGNGRIAIEIKSTEEVKARHLKGLNAFKEDFLESRIIIVSFDKYLRMMNSVGIFPSEQFLKALWREYFV
jgi:hypothetical protein